MPTKIKPKLPTRKSLVKKLDKALWDLLKEAEPFCVTCNKTIDSGAKFAPGHYITRGVYALRWDLNNVHTQCWGCNFKHEYDPLPYTLYLQKRYGPEIFDYFNDKRRVHTKFSNSDLLGILGGLSGKVI